MYLIIRWKAEKAQETRLLWIHYPVSLKRALSSDSISATFTWVKRSSCMSLLWLVNICRVVQKGGWGREVILAAPLGHTDVPRLPSPFGHPVMDWLMCTTVDGRRGKKVSSSCSFQSVPTCASRSLEPWLRLAHSHSSGGTWELFPSNAEPNVLYHEAEAVLPSSWQFPHAGEGAKECLECQK